MHYGTAQLAAITLAMTSIMAMNCAAEEITAADIVAKCRIRTDAADLRGHLDFYIRDASGKTLKDRHAFYFWKDYGGVNDLWSKTILFVAAPPEEKYVSYLRYEYMSDSGREAEQWLYVPRLHQVTRLAIRDPRDQTWGVVGDDLAVLQLNDGGQRLLRTEKNERGTIYWIEAIPKTKTTKLPYVKVESAYLREGDGWDRCARWRTKFVDKDDNIIKVLTEDWDRKNQIWYRQRVTIENMKANTNTEYALSDPEFNTGLADEDFTQRMMPFPDRLIRPGQ